MDADSGKQVVEAVLTQKGTFRWLLSFGIASE